MAPTGSPTAAPTAAPTGSPTAAPSAAPIAAPTAAPTVAPTALPRVSASGDPHLVNVRGQHFDVMKPGAHVLLLVPFKARPLTTLLRVDADARQVGGACADTYFMSVNITGKWAEAIVHNQKLGSGHGLTFSAGTGASHTGTEWMSFGTIALKVVHGRTDEGIAYLNFFARNLRGAGYPIGGLLGEDDHSEATTPRRECRRVFDV
mmetsp:Transcript_24931/g.65119  ORF Transcript_24931/g.65119 Transcript_24931/m.65119 type:complete len:205 (+) Transcript_24931:1-615(+)